MKYKAHKGFTLVEFIVIISIFAIMVSVAMFNFNGFRSNISLNNLAHDVGLTIRQAQVFGWSNQSDSSKGAGIKLGGVDPQTGNPERFAEGVYFDTSNPLTSKQIILYKKNTANTIPSFDTGTDTIVDTVAVTGPNKIGALYYAQSKEDLMIDQIQANAGSATKISELSISFTRPRPEAMFFTQGSVVSNPFNYAGIYIQGDFDTTFSHVVIISRTGEIDVQ